MADDPKSPAAPTALMTTTVSSVGGLESRCHQQNSSGSIALLKTGFVACLLNKASLITVAILDEPSFSPQVQTSRQAFLQKLALEATNLLPFSFFDSKVAASLASTDYFISFDYDGQLELYDTKLHALTPIPCIKYNDEYLVKKSVSVLRHIHAFCALRDLKPSAMYKKPLFEFQVRDVGANDASQDPKVLTSKEVIFKNLEPPPTNLHTLFIIILNLTSAFGVYQVFPYDDAQSIVVEPGNPIPELLVDIVLPEIFNRWDVTQGRLSCEIA